MEIEVSRDGGCRHDSHLWRKYGSSQHRHLRFPGAHRAGAAQHTLHLHKHHWHHQRHQSSRRSRWSCRRRISAGIPVYGVCRYSRGQHNGSGYLFCLRGSPGGFSPLQFPQGQNLHGGHGKSLSRVLSCRYGPAADPGFKIISRFHVPGACVANPHI